jgi:hypothetical protein
MHPLLGSGVGNVFIAADQQATIEELLRSILRLYSEDQQKKVAGVNS